MGWMVVGECMTMEVIGLDPVYVAVRDLSASEAFYDPVMRLLGVAATEPESYPEYAPDYYATSFGDSDGIPLELVAEIGRRRLPRDRWEALRDFEHPLSKAGLWRG